jgi:L-fuconate dehydratase
MACGAILNALWDIWAKAEEKPMWKLMVDLEPAFIVEKCIDWRNIQDALSKDEALAILNKAKVNKVKREADMSEVGPKAYCTAGWLGLSNEQIIGTINKLRDNGFDSFKLKVGQDLDQDIARIKFMRESIGPETNLMVDANQYWGVEEAKTHMRNYLPYNLQWVEEPIARDDVLGYVELKKEFETASFAMACGEQAASPVIFKQLLKTKAIGFCQIDSVRVAGVNDVMAIILMAAKFDIPVCPHGGGISLCSLIQHYCMWDQIAVAGHSKTQLCEYIDFLSEAQKYPIATRYGHYVTPRAHGWGLDFDEKFLAEHTFPDGSVWKDRPQNKCGILFEALD